MHRRSLSRSHHTPAAIFCEEAAEHTDQGNICQANYAAWGPMGLMDEWHHTSLANGGLD